MIVQKYGRRSRCIGRSFSDSSFDGVDEHEAEETTTFRESLSQETPSQDVYNFAFSSQDSSPWTFDSDLYASNSLPPLPKRNDNNKGGAKGSKKVRALTRKKDKNLNLKEIKKSGVLKGGGSMSSMNLPSTSTLMEAQEFGEMMEHVDEVNFALGGLRKGQQARIRRASLLSLLSICATASKRRLLRTNGMAKIILDAVLSLSFDDSPSTLAAAALFYVLASDGQDDNLLDSPTCIRFLIRLLSPSMPTTTEDRRPTIGRKLLALCKDPGTVGDRVEKLDASSTAIISKVQEILLSCKELQSSKSIDRGVGRPELSPKWIALLTMEKACLSTVSLEETTGTVKRSGGNFKERLRELGGLDAVFDVAINCHSVMEKWSDNSFHAIRELKDDIAFQTMVLLLKCLKIMENATFLSKDNQDHLLGMNGKLEGSSVSFTGLVISLIRILSGLSVLQYSSTSSDDRSHCHSAGMDSASESLLEMEQEVDRILSSNSYTRCYSTEENSQVERFKTSQKRQKLSDSQSVYSVSNSETIAAFITDSCLVKKEASTSSSCNGTLKSSNAGSFKKTCTPKMNLGLCKKPSTKRTDFPRKNKSTKRTEYIVLDDSPDPFAFDETVKQTCSMKINLGQCKNPSTTESTEYILVEDSQDPFAFDEGEFVPSKWDLLSKRKEVSHTQESKGVVRDVENGCRPLESGWQSQSMTTHTESNSRQDFHFHDFSCLRSVVEENSDLLADCLLTAIKVLMNLTNDNSVGCKQIASHGGLETVPTLIVGHFPRFSSMSPNSQTEETMMQLESSSKLEHRNDRHMTDLELDFLVAILGLLVNLVEKDSQNRSRLAATNVLLPASEGRHRHMDVIPLLCSIFLLNQGAGEVADERKLLSLDDEDALLHGEREAEKMIVEAYSALLLAFLSTESKDVREAIAYCLPDHKLEILVPVLERFVEFHLTLNMISPETHTAVTEVIESCKGH